MCEQEDFRPELVFHRIDRQRMGMIRAHDILEFLAENNLEDEGVG